jgi:hypothetical protein
MVAERSALDVAAGDGQAADDGELVPLVHGACTPRELQRREDSAMTSPDPRPLDLTGFDTGFDPHDDPQSRADRGDLRLLRLALDLQLDAILLTLGAAAHAETRGASSHRTPWRRWLVEDLDLARSLATALVDGDGPPVPGLGDSLSHAGIGASLDNLATRFENMENLLAGALDRPSSGQPRRGVVGEALQRCRTRLSELRRHRRQEIAVAAAASAPSLPGEWLG